MKNSPIPFNEALRLQDLYHYAILDTEDDPAFNGLVELAAMICDCPIAAISFLDKDRQWFKARKNIDETQTARNISFCTHVVFQESTLVVENAACDDRFREHPEVMSSGDIRFYAGEPIFSSTGNAIGTICVVDHQPRQLSEEKIKALHLIAKQITVLLEMRLKNKLLQEQLEVQQSEENYNIGNIIRSIDKEKMSIATSVHENLAQTLAASRLFMEEAIGNGPAAKNHIRKAIDSINESIAFTRGLSATMSPSTLVGMNIFSVIDDLVHDFNRNNNTAVNFCYDEAIEEACTEEMSNLIYQLIRVQLRDYILGGGKSMGIRLHHDERVIMTITVKGCPLPEFDDLFTARLRLLGAKWVIEENSISILFRKPVQTLAN